MIAKRIAACIAGLMMIAGFTLMGATPAQADQYDCDSHRMCLWVNNSYGGGIREVEPRHRTCYTLWGFNDTASSYWNNSNAQVTLYTNNNCSGSIYPISRHRNASSMPGYNDRASSIWFHCPSTGC